MNAITQDPIQYNVQKTLIITQLDINPPASDDPESVGHLQIAVSQETDTVRVSGNISRHTATFDVVGLLKAAAVALTNGDAKKIRRIQDAFVGDFLHDYQFALTQPIKDSMFSMYKGGVYWELIGDVIFSITGDRPANQIFITELTTKGPVAYITGTMLGTAVSISSSSEPSVTINKLARALLTQIFGPNFGTNLVTDDLVNKHLNLAVSKDIFANLSALNAVWQTYLIETCPPEPSDAAKELAAAMQKGEHENCLTKLVDFMFDKNAVWDPEQQLQRNIVGKAHGAEVQLTVVHAVGNFFVKGYIGGRRLRIYKDHSTLQLYTTSFDVDFNMDRCTKSIPVHRQAEFEEWLIRLAKVQAELEQKG